MPNEIAKSPKTVTSRVRDWLSDKLETLVERVSTVVVSSGVVNVAAKQATKQTKDTLEEMEKGMSAAIDATRAMKAKITAEDKTEQDIFDMFKCATLTQTRLLTEAFSSGIAPQPIDREQLARPTTNSFSLPSASLSDELNDLPQMPESEPTPEEQEGPEPTPGPQKKRGGGRPLGSKDKAPRARKNRLKTP